MFQGIFISALNDANKNYIFGTGSIPINIKTAQLATFADGTTKQQGYQVAEVNKLISTMLTGWNANGNKPKSMSDNYLELILSCDNGFVVKKRLQFPHIIAWQNDNTPYNIADVYKQFSIDNWLKADDFENPDITLVVEPTDEILTTSTATPPEATTEQSGRFYLYYRNLPVGINRVHIDFHIKTKTEPIDFDLEVIDGLSLKDAQVILASNEQAKINVLLSGVKDVYNFTGAEGNFNEITMHEWNALYQQIISLNPNNKFTHDLYFYIYDESELNTKLTELESNTNTKLIKLNKKIGGFSQKEVDDNDGFYICNEKGEVLLRLDILDTKNPIGDNMISYITKHVKKEIPSPCIEDGFYICNENGEVIAQYKDNEWQFIGIEKEVKINPCYSSLGLESGVMKADSLSNGELVLINYPQYLKRNATVSFGATINTFSQVKVGIKGSYFCLVQLDSTNISIIHNTGTIKTEAHGLNISGWIDVALKVEELNVEISVHTLDGYKKITATLPFRELYGRPTLEVDENTTLTDVSLRGYCDDFQKSIWFVGDSYTSCTEVRWTGQMLNFGINNWMLLGVAGGKSKDLYEDLLLALKYGTPTYLVWCMGMNDADNGSLNVDYKKYFELVKGKCDELGVIMIPATVPCVKTSAHPTYARDNSYKNAFIKASGLRYIDLAKAVGGDTFTEDAWYEGYLETKSTWIHTSELGAKAQMAQIIRDFPEILRNK